MFPTAIKSSQGATGIKDDFTDCKNRRRNDIHHHSIRASPSASSWPAMQRILMKWPRSALVGQQKDQKTGQSHVLLSLVEHLVSLPRLREIAVRYMR